MSSASIRMRISWELNKVVGHLGTVPITLSEFELGGRRKQRRQSLLSSFSSVADPDPDPYVFGPPESGSTSQSYGSGSFYHHAKIVRKTLIPTIL
jgi:hypothetical protein